MNYENSLKKILITGASGFIGSFLVDEALKRGYTVYAGVRESSSRAYLSDSRIRFFNMDISTRGSLEDQLKSFAGMEGGFDIVIHNAGITRAQNKSEFEKINNLYTQNLADALIASGHPPQKFIFVSSLATYGPGEITGKLPIRLDDPQRPVSSYGKSKLAAEKYLRSLADLNTVIVRPTAVYGPRDKDFLSYFKMIVGGIDLQIGKDRQTLSFIYVKDLASIIFDILNAPYPKPAYIISDNQTYQKNEMGVMIKKILKKKALTLTLPLTPLRFSVSLMEKVYSFFGRMPFIHSEKLIEISAANWACDSSITWNEFQKHPLYDFEKGLIETIAFYMEKGWLKK